MKVSALLHVMDKDDFIVIDNFDKPINNTLMYAGKVRGITRDSPINRMHVSSIWVSDDTIFILAEKPQRKDKVMNESK